LLAAAIAGCFFTPKTTLWLQRKNFKAFGTGSFNSLQKWLTLESLASLHRLVQYVGSPTAAWDR
jgi:hypothetical protein